MNRIRELREANGWTQTQLGKRIWVAKTTITGYEREDRQPTPATIFYELLESLNIENPVDEDGRHRLTPHSCRQTFATLLKRAQGSDTDKLALIGHTSTDQLRDYQDVPVEDLRRIIDQI